MPTIEELQKKYEALNDKTVAEAEERINPSCLLCFDYEYPGQDTEVAIDTDEFTAVCPWTGLPDTGTLKVSYVPDRLCIELKSLKYYLLSYRDVGIVQEHAANRILNDLVASANPLEMTVTLDYRVRGGLHTVVTAHYAPP
jgi:7-cyano-7-deazaguanine reductase